MRSLLYGARKLVFDIHIESPFINKINQIVSLMKISYSIFKAIRYKTIKKEFSAVDISKKCIRNCLSYCWTNKSIFSSINKMN